MALVSDDPFSTSPKRIKLDLENMDHILKDTHPISTMDANINAEVKPLIDESSEIPSNSNTEAERPIDGIEVEVDGELADEEDIDNDDEDDTSSTVSNVSDFSCLSDMSGHQWKSGNIIGTMNWIEKQMINGVSPRVVFNQLVGENTELPESISDTALWRVIFSYLTEPPKRNRLAKTTSLEDVIQLLQTCSKIIVLTGAGVSVSCGIPDFRSKDGVYARLAVDFPNLPDPQAMFDINYFRQDPRPFFKFAKEIYPGQFKPSPCHRFIKMLEKQKKLLRNYTQNIDTLEKVAEIENVVECHGSFATATCTRCGHKVTCDDIKKDVFNQSIPFCTQCGKSDEQTNTEEGVLRDRGIMKPDIVFFGEGLPERFHDAMAFDKDKCDLLIVIGSSLKVRPVALIPSSLPSHVPQVLINRERLPHMNFDVELLGDSDVVVDHLCRILGGDWKEICWRDNPLTDCTETLPVNVSCSSDSLSSEEESEDAEIIEENPQPVKCQRIGKRHIADDDNSRHISLDSSRDSGIGEGSNNSNDSPPPSSIIQENCFYRQRKRRYIFPGAEVMGLFPYMPNSSPN
uniref:protein acetyllysine N-acetyltransferase n=1 Tax=Panstrongylus lignarius TaxID=156445 RepID=A0A224XMH2_9HEMI